MRTAILASVILAAIVPLRAQEEIPVAGPTSTPERVERAEPVKSADEVYRGAILEMTSASNLERKGKREEAANSYELAGRMCEESISAFEREAVSEVDRPIDLYFRCATSFLHAGRVLSAEKQRDEERKDEDLRLATNYLEKVEKLETERARRNHTAVNPEIWRVHNAAGYACFLRGELARARTHYQSVLDLNPSYKPAEQAVAKITELERRENEIFSPQGRTLDKEKKMKAVRGVVDTLKLVRDIVKLGL